MKIIIGCERSQAITKAFRARGHEAFSNDLEACTGGHPEWHIQGDIFEVITYWGGVNMFIVHPPCTYVAGSSVQWLSHPDDKKLHFNKRREHPLYPGRRQQMIESVEFVKRLWALPVKNMVLENPIGMLSTLWMPPTQIIQPYYFGDQAQKATCLWIRGLPPLFHAAQDDLFSKKTHVDRGEFITLSSGKRLPKWYSDASKLSDDKRREIRSNTFSGIANAMAEQWG